MNALRKFLFGGITPASKLADAALTLLRIAAGLMMAAFHGWGKLPPSADLVQGVESMGFPLPTVFAWAAGLSEFVGGILLAIGLCTRPAAFFIACTMIVAAFIVHRADPLAAREMAILYLGVSLVFLANGAGRFGFDPALRK